jgi:predicted Zn-dependent peptidase
MNAFTTTDFTAYFITVPANKLELWMWMESERLLRPVFREFYAERDVVFEERRMRTESTPLGKFAEAFEAMVWTAHPYQWPIVGWPSDIPAISKADADLFYSLYYSPQNICLILVGDFKIENAMRLAERYFSRIEKGKADPPEVITREVRQLAEKRMYAEAEANPEINIVWHTVPFSHRDVYALNILAQLLSTETGRLYKGLVLDREVATSVQASPVTRKWAGLFDITAEVKDGHTPEEVEQAIYEELEKLKNEDVPPDELQKVKNAFAAYEYRRLTSNHSILMQLMFNDGLGDWREINRAGPLHQAVSAADVRRVVNDYFTRETRSVAVYTRKAGEEGATEDTVPDLSGLDPSMIAAVRNMADRLKKETDVKKLSSVLSRMEQAESGADEKTKVLLGVQKKLIQQRIKELK